MRDLAALDQQYGEAARSSNAGQVDSMSLTEAKAAKLTELTARHRDEVDATNKDIASIEAQNRASAAAGRAPPPVPAPCPAIGSSAP